MYHLVPLGITCRSIDAVFHALIESEWALCQRGLEASGEGGDREASGDEMQGTLGLEQSALKGGGHPG